MARLQYLKQNHEIFVVRSTVMFCRFTTTKQSLPPTCNSVIHGDKNRSQNFKLNPN